MNGHKNKSSTQASLLGVTQPRIPIIPIRVNPPVGSSPYMGRRRRHWEETAPTQRSPTGAYTQLSQPWAVTREVLIVTNMWDNADGDMGGNLLSPVRDLWLLIGFFWFFWNMAGKVPRLSSAIATRKVALSSNRKTSLSLYLFLKSKKRPTMLRNVL